MPSSPFLLLTLTLSLTSCSNPGKVNQTVPSNTPAPRPELPQLYTQAIAEYIRVVGEKDNFRFDTLFLGNTFETPDVQLPPAIDGVQVRLLAQEEIELKKAGYRKSSPYINLIAFVEADKADFIFVTFYPEFAHQYDVYLGFTYHADKQAFQPRDSRVEVLIRDNAGKPVHYAVYEAGKFVRNRPVDKE